MRLRKDKKKKYQKRNIKRNQLETPEWKSKISGKNSLNGVNNIMEMTDEKFNELENRPVGINQIEEYMERY